MLQRYEKSMVLALTSRGIPRVEIAKMLHITAPTIRKILREHNLLNEKRVEGAKRGCEKMKRKKIANG